ncbi:TetR/AcrR family transcriptional regulator [Aliihoeflea sp. PC F10.4]
MKRPSGRPSSRERLLDAAEALAHEQGSANISLDAVAARAGLSKGGLLYNFPTKAKLLEALVERHIARAQEALTQSERLHEAGPNAVALAYIDYCRNEMCVHPKPASGILAAIAENPGLIDPVRRHQRHLVATMREQSKDLPMSLIALLVIEGMWSMRMFETNCLGSEETDAVFERLSGELAGKIKESASP